MEDLRDAVVAFRNGTVTGAEYPTGSKLESNGVTFGQPGSTDAFKFGTSQQIRLIEPWGIRVRAIIWDNAAANFADYANVEYGMIFYHDKTNAYADGMSIEQITTKGDAQVYSKANGGAWAAANSINAIYAEGIFTHELDTNLYCLPYVVVDGTYYYRSSVLCLNLLTEMEAFAADTTLTVEERAVFEAMLQLHDDTIAFKG
jgi:hypothetical protein